MKLFLIITLLAPLLVATLAGGFPVEDRDAVVSVYLSETADPRLQQCVENSIKSVNDGTCLRMRLVNNNTMEANVTFVETTSNGPCGVDTESSTIYINPNCISGHPLSHQVCLQLLGRALTLVEDTFTNVVPGINSFYQCENLCPLACENGRLEAASEFSECNCVCPQSGLFTGPICSELVKLSDYTDSTCGVIQVNNSNPEGTLKLHTPMDGNTYCQWLLYSESAWNQVELNITDLEMSQRFAGAMNCSDKLQVYDGGISMIER